MLTLFAHEYVTFYLENLFPTSKLLCVVCKDSFVNPWDLMVHAQTAHMVNIYEIGESDDDEESTGSHKTNELEKINGKIHTNGMLPSCNGNGNLSHSQKSGNSINGDVSRIKNTFFIIISSLFLMDKIKKSKEKLKDKNSIK